MPKKYKDLKNKDLDDKLTGQEKLLVKEVENYIDTQIVAQWQNGSVLVKECVVQFECDPVTGVPTGIPEDRRIIMRDLVFSRFQDAGWNNNFSGDARRRFTPISTK